MPYENERKWMSFDPGGTTGVCIYRRGMDNRMTVPSIARGSTWETIQIGPQPHHVELWRLLTDQDPDIIICERFLNIGNAAAVTVSMEYVGIIILYCQLRDKPLVLQNASQAKAFWTDHKLKWLGLYQPNQKHSMDALRHMLHFMTFNKKLAKYIHLLRVYTNTSGANDGSFPGEGPLEPEVVDLPSSQDADK